MLASEGMVLGWPIYDSDGLLIANFGDELDADCIAKVQENGIIELIVEDSRVMDVPVVPMVPPAEGSKLIQGVRLITSRLQNGESVHAENIAQLALHLNAMIVAMRGSILGEASMRWPPSRRSGTA